MEIVNYVVENRIILVPVLYVLGYVLKQTNLIKDKYIPISLVVFGIVLSVAMLGDTVINNVIQGILVAGVTVLGNQLIKQSKKGE